MQSAKRSLIKTTVYSIVGTVVLSTLLGASGAAHASSTTTPTTIKVNTNDKLYKQLAKTWPLTLKKLQEKATETGTPLKTLIQQTIDTMKANESRLLKAKKPVQAKRFTYLIHIATQSLNATSGVSTTTTTNTKPQTSTTTTTTTTTDTSGGYTYNGIKNPPATTTTNTQTTQGGWIDLVNGGDLNQGKTKGFIMFDGGDGSVYILHDGGPETVKQDVTMDNSKYFYLKDTSQNNFNGQQNVGYYRLAKSSLLKVSKDFFTNKVNSNHYNDLSAIIMGNYSYWREDVGMTKDKALQETLNRINTIYNDFSQFQSIGNNDEKISQVYQYILNNYTWGSSSIDLTTTNLKAERQIGTMVSQNKNGVCAGYTDLYHMGLIFSRISDNISIAGGNNPESGVGHNFLKLSGRDSDITVASTDSPFVSQSFDTSGFSVRNL